MFVCVIMFETLPSLMWCCLCLLALLASLVLLSLWGATLLLRSRASKQRESQGEREGLSVAFFHPYCNAGGGGERVLWCAVKATLARYPAATITIYTGDTEAAPDMILAKAKDRFNMELKTDNIHFVYLHRRGWVEAARWET